MNVRHQQFVTEYLKCWNATEAYRKVYPKSSDEAARRSASDLLTNPDVSAEVQRRVAENAMSADEVLIRLGEQARAAYSQYLTAEGVDLTKMIADGKGHLIKSVKDTQWGKVVEFYDAQSALVQLGKHHKLFIEKHEHEMHADFTFTSDDAAKAREELEQWKQQARDGQKSNG